MVNNYDEAIRFFTEKLNFYKYCKISATEPKMSAICIRYRSEKLSNEALTKLHIAVAARIEKEGNFWFATTELKSKAWFRINPVNIYTTIETMEALFKTLQQYCKEAEERMLIVNKKFW